MTSLLLTAIFFATAAVMLSTLIAGVIGRLGFPLPPADRRIGCIDGLRGYLALSVMIHHFFIWIGVTRFGSLWNAPKIHFINELGVGGVALFFMITGLVFYPRIRSGARLIPWFSLYITRFFRIVPLVTLSVAFIISIIAVRTATVPKLKDIFPAILWVSSISEPPLIDYADSGRINAYVFWSLRLEWLFYIFFIPVSAIAMDIIRVFKFPTWTLPLMLILGPPIIRTRFHPPPFLSDICHYLPLFALGMLAFEIQTRPIFRRVLAGRLAAALSVSGLVAGMFSFEFPYGSALPLFGFFFICIACGNSLGGLLTSLGAIVLGECSFGIYLLHAILLDMLFVDVHGFVSKISTIELPFLIPIIAVALVLFTAVTYRLIEKPSINIGRHLSRRFEGRRVLPTSRELDLAP